MKKVYLTIVLMFFFACFSNISFAEDPAILIADMVRPAVVTIYNDRSLGSGFIVSSEGYIITNKHVVKDNSKLRIVMIDGKEFNGRVIAEGQEDVALIEMETKNLPSLRIGKGYATQAGENLIWFGSPKGLTDSVARGSMANNQRMVNGTRYLQLDGYVNGGNSGGPVLNMRGEVIGIVTMKATNADGIGYALPIEVAYDILRSYNIAVNVSTGVQELAFLPRDTTNIDKTQSDKNGSASKSDGNWMAWNMEIIIFLLLSVFFTAGGYWLGRRKRVVEEPRIELHNMEEINIVLKQKQK